MPWRKHPENGTARKKSDGMGNIVEMLNWAGLLGGIASPWDRTRIKVSVPGRGF